MVKRVMDFGIANRTLATLARMPPTELPLALKDRLGAEPGCPVAHYLLGCHCFDRARFALGVRHMMVAYRIEPAFESAALLVFAGLNWVSRRDVAMLPVLLDTWEEFRRPEFDRRRKERRLLGAFAKSPEGVEGLSPLARRLWRLPIRTLRAQLREAVVSGDAAVHPLLLAPV